MEQGGSNAPGYICSYASQQLVRRYRQVSDAFAGGMRDCISDGRGHADDTDLTQSLGAERVDDLVRFLNEDHLDVVNVGVNRDVVVREVVGHEPSEGMVDHTLSFQGRADAHDDGPHDLTPRRLHIENAAGRNTRLRSEKTREGGVDPLLVTPV
jgi:hypothetical protein